MRNTIRSEWLAELAELRERAGLACDKMRRNIEEYRAIAARGRWPNRDSLHKLHLGVEEAGTCAAIETLSEGPIHWPVDTRA